MKIKLALLTYILISTSVYSQNFTLIDNYNFKPKLEYNGKMLGFYYSNYSTADLILTDGSSDGSVILQSGLIETEGYYRSRGLDWTIYNNKIYFSATGGNGDELYVTDGTRDGTYMLKDILPQDGTIGVKFGYPKYFKNYNNKFYFSGRASRNYNYTNQIWESDGTTEGTKILTILPYDNLAPEPCKFNLLNDMLYFEAYRNEIWKTDGTPTGTIKVKNIGFGHSIRGEIIPFQDKFIFTTYLYNPNSPSISNLWVSDGTTDGTFILQKLNDSYGGDGDDVPNNFQTNRNFITFNDKLYIITSQNLRATDGTTEGTSVIKNFNSKLGGNVEIIIYTNKMIFIRGGNLWESDGTENGTLIIKELPSSYHESLRISNGLIFFYSKVDSGNLNLWVSDGTKEGTSPLGTPVSSPNTLQVHHLFSYNNDIYTSTYISGANSPMGQFWKLKQDALSITKSNVEAEFILYPNPLEDLLKISSKTNLKKIEICNNLGQILLTTSKKNNINTSCLTSGIYFVKIENINGDIGVKKVIKK